MYAFIYNLQEEAHRFAIKASSGAKTKSLTKSSLEKISGIGPAKAKKLLAAMPLSKIKTAEKEELADIPGISLSDAENIYNHFHKE